MKRRTGIAGAAAVIAAVILAATMLGRQRESSDLAASGSVEATDAQIGFQVAGRVLEISVREGDRVVRGDLLARLDMTEATARRDQAMAQLDAARALLGELQQGPRPQEIAQARAARDATKQRLEDADRDLARARALFDGGAISREALDKATLARDVASSHHEGSRQQLDLLEAGTRMEKVEAQRAAVSQAEAAVRVIDALIENMTLRAPFDGLITERHREQGEAAPAGSPVLTIMDPDDRWVRIYIPETRMGDLHLGSKARIMSDAGGDRTYAGTVVFLSSEAEFTPKTVQTREERVKLVYAAKVRIEDDSTLDLKPGMPVDVEVDLPKR